MVYPFDLPKLIVNSPERQTRGIDFPYCVAPKIPDLSDSQKKDLEVVSMTANAINTIGRVAYNFRDGDKNSETKNFTLQEPAINQVVSLIDTIRMAGKLNDMRKGARARVIENADLVDLIQQIQQSQLNDAEKASRVTTLEGMKQQSQADKPFPISTEQVAELYSLNSEAAQWKMAALNKMSVDKGLYQSEFENKTIKVKSRMDTPEKLDALIALLPGLFHDLRTPLTSLKVLVQMHARRDTDLSLKSQATSPLWNQLFENMGMFSRTILEGLQHQKFGLSAVTSAFDSYFNAQRHAMLNSVFLAGPDNSDSLYVYWDEAEMQKTVAFNILQNADRQRRRKILQGAGDEAFSVTGSVLLVDGKGNIVDADQSPKYMMLRFVDDGLGMIDKRLLGENPFEAGINGHGDDSIESHGDGMKGVQLLVKQRGGKVVTSHYLRDNNNPTDTPVLASRMPKSHESIVGTCVDIYLPIYQRQQTRRY